MSLRRLLGIALVLALGQIAARAGGQGFEATTQGEFRVEWAVTMSTAGRPVIDGYLGNGASWWYKRVRLDVAALDDGGRVIGHTTVYVPGDVPPGGRVYFSAKLGGAGARYRVSVASFERTAGGPSG